MDDLEQMQNRLEKAIDKDNIMLEEEPKQSDTTVIIANPDQRSIRDRLDEIIQSRKFMIFVIVLVVLDCMMVIAELLFDLEIVELGEDHKYVPKIFHYLSLTILSIFMIEISLRFYVLRLAFFKHKLEVLDALIVIVSFILDIVFRDNEDASTGVGLLIILRLWRITRIVNGIVLSVEKQAEQKVGKERLLRHEVEQELKEFQNYSSTLEERIEEMKGLLLKHNIEYSGTEVKRPVVKNRGGAEAEANKRIHKAHGDND